MILMILIVNQSCTFLLPGHEFYSHAYFKTIVLLPDSQIRCVDFISNPFFSCI